ncbi:L,D-transpeptidase family protein [Candidatus Leptofilum sp.]|uniref:L,D-transpeptidase family protein n=1 Tax=Candidatus Leptofilum sp. TaxID=3241576 RepID=UPI003B5C6C40
MQTSELKTQFFRRPAAPKPSRTDTASPVQVRAMAEAPTQLWFPAAQPDVLPPPVRRKRPFLKHLFVGLILLTLLAIGFTAVAGASLFYMSEMVLPGVRVMSTDVGRMTLSEAAVALSELSSQQTIRLTHGETVWLISAEELGLTMDATATAENAHEYGRTPAAWFELIQTGAMTVEPIWILDTAVAQTTLQARADELAVEPINAGLIIENGQVTVTPAVDGQMLDVTATVSALAQTGATAVNQNGKAAQSRPIPLAMQVVPAAITDVSGVVAQAEALLSTTITIHATDPVRDEAVSWVVGPQVWGSWLTLAVDPNDTTRFDWVIEPDKAAQFFTERNVALGENRYLDSELALTAVADAIKNQQERIDLRIYHSPSQYVVQPGDTFAGIGRKVGIPYPWIQAANPGVADALIVGQTLTIPSPDELLPYPVVDGKRVVVSISQQRAWVYENGALKWEWLASTGIASSPTAPGVFQIQTHEPNAYAANWDLWMPSFMGIYQPAPNVEFMNGFHGFPTRDGANLLWTSNLGTPVTYGCILLSNENVAQLYEWAEQGVIVEIMP